VLQIATSRPAECAAGEKRVDPLLRNALLAEGGTRSFSGRMRRRQAPERSFCRHFICPDAKLRQGSRTKGMGERHVCGVAALRDEDASDPRRIVARIEHAPTAAEIDFDPRRKIIGRIRRQADIGNVTGAIARRDVQAAAKSDGKMRIVAAHTTALGVCFTGRSGGAGMLVAERYVVLDEVADRLHPRPTGRRLAEQAPCLVGETIGLAVPAAEQKQ
jgi:hypothetical protein